MTQDVPMSLPDLEGRLELEGVSAGAVSIDGSAKDETYCLVETPLEWQVFYSERGQRNDVRQFKLFVEAAAEFLRQVLSDPTTRR
jgi:hypothetical protein